MLRTSSALPNTCRARSAARGLRGFCIGKNSVRRAGLSLSQTQRRYAASSSLGSDSFLQGNTASYVDAMYDAWRKDPSSVHVSWQAYFSNMDKGVPAQQAFVAPPTIVPTPTGGIPSLTPGSGAGSNNVTDHLKVQLLVRAYQVRGHHRAHLDPLGIMAGADLDAGTPAELTLEHYGFTESDLDTEYSLGPGILKRFATEGREKMTLREIVAACERIYCGSYGCEYVHIPDRHQCDWLRDRLEIPVPYAYSIDEKRRILDRLIWADSFERFLSTKYPNDKRFGLEGCESLIPGLKALIDDSVERGIESVVIGMPHRGRLNVLSNVVRKPNEAIFSEFAGSQDPSDEGSGDVKYHLGMNYERPTPSGKRVNLSLVANPSHLEAEDPVVLGKTRAIQHYSNDETTHEKAMGLLLHGDAAFAAQGVVYETMGFHSLPGYSTGGTIHVIVNNQIGFTTDPRFARSTPYPSDIAKSINAPIFHVNGDDVEALNFIFQLASEWRSTWKHDVVIDVVCYRKYGHNETDQPAFTQPRMYQAISKKQSIMQIYTKKLIEENSFTENEIEEHKKWVWSMLEESFGNAKNYEPTAREWLTSAWTGFATPKDIATKIIPHLPTAVPENTLKEVGKVISEAPEGFNVHRNLKRILTNRGKTVSSGEGVDMPTGEALAFGTLLLEGHHIRVSGQDVERGTFSQRHAVLHDQVTEATFVPLNHLGEDQASFVIQNSSLSEFGVLGFEYGYSLSSPNALVMWEAQFGDFANNAQCIIDQFISSAEAKWLQRSGLVMSLPHGYDGQGPEHSNAHIERYLQLCNEPAHEFPSEEKLQRQHQDCNMQVIYPTTPANVFHFLRRQIHSEIRKPLVYIFSKALLRHPLARSNLEDFSGDNTFKWILRDHLDGTDKINATKDIKRVVLCSGQVWTKFCAFRDERNIKDTAVIRIEQLHPWPYAQLTKAFEEYESLEDIVYLAEEPYNLSPATFAEPRLATTLAHTSKSGIVPRFVTRPASASPATGNKIQHANEEKRLMLDTFQVQE